MRSSRVLPICVVLINLSAPSFSQSILTIAGGGTDDGRLAVVADLSYPTGVALDAAGNLYVADWNNQRVRMISASTGIITTVAGNGSAGFTGDGGLATAASLNDPMSVAIDGGGNLLIADMGNKRIRRVQAGNGIITTIAGSGVWGFEGDGGPATAAAMAYPTGLTVAPSGDIYFADSANNRIRRIASFSGIITTVAGSGTNGYSGDGGPATLAALRLSGPAAGSITVGSPPSVAVDAAGTVYFSDTFNHRIRRVDAGGTISTIAGNGSESFSGDGGAATAAALDGPTGLALDGAGNLLIADGDNDRVRRLALASGIIMTIAGSGGGFSGDGGPAASARFSCPVSVAFNAAGDLFVADKFNDRIRRIAAGSSIITTYAGSGVRFSGDGPVATAALILGPAALAFDPAGPITIAEYDAYRIRRLSMAGAISTIAGTGQIGSGGDGGLATQVGLTPPGGVALDGAGNVYFADIANNRIRRVAALTGIITTVAGTNTRGFSGDGGPATSANLNLSSPDDRSWYHAGFPPGVAIDTNGDLYFSDTFNYRIRKIAASTGVITTIAGSGTAGFSGDGGSATAAQFDAPTGLAIDRNYLYVADTYTHRIRRIDLLLGTIATVAGSGPTGIAGGYFSGDGGLATSARLFDPTGIAIDTAGNLYVADKSNLRIRKITSGIISTIAGNGVFGSGFTGDGGPAVNAGLSYPYGVGVDRKNNVYVADTEANRVRAVFACVAVAAPQLTAPANGVTGLGSAPSISWNRADGAFRYDVYLSTLNPPALLASDLTATTYTPANLATGATYYFRVVAKGDPFCVPASSASSETRSFSTSAGCEAPGAFEGSQPADGATGQPQSVQLTWQPAAGAGTYDLYFGPSNPPPLLATGIRTTSYGVSSPTSNTTHYWSVTAHASCDASKVRASAVRSFRTAGSCAPAGSFSLSSPANGSASVALTTTLAWTASSNASGYDIYLGTSTLPPIYYADVPSNAAAVSGLLPARTYYWRVGAKVACDPSKSVTSPVFSFTTAGGCAPPPETRITFVPPGNVGVGQTYTVAWEEVADLDEEGFYLAERSTTSSFTQILDSQQTFSPSASFISNTAGAYYHRVRAVRGCDPSHPGAASEVKSVNVVTGTANVVFTVQPQAVVTGLGDKLEDKRATLSIENLGSSSLQVILGKGEINSVPFFTISDPAGGDAVFVTLEPKTPKTFEVRFSGPANNQAAAYQGLVFVAATGQGLAITPYAFVNLKVGGGTTTRPIFQSGGTQTEYAFFPGFSGDDSSRPAISVDIRNSGSSPMELGAEIGPEVWLVPESGWNATPIAAGATRSVKLRTQRNRAPNGSALPRYTYFTVRSKNGETARILVQDNDDLRRATGRSSLLEPGTRSYVVPGVTSQTSPSVFTRLQLTNVGSEAVQAELLFTPAGSDGFGGSVKGATVIVPPNDVVTLTDPLVQVFGLTPPARGQIEVRAARERIGFLIVAGTAVAPSASGGADRVQLATLRSGEGARVGSAHALVDVSSSASTRTTLILAETSGIEETRVRTALFDANGGKRGETTVSVPRYGETSIDLAGVSGGTLDTGRIRITVESGGGSVAGVVTMLHATRNTGATLVSQPEEGTTSGQAMARMARRASQTSGTTVFVPLVISGTQAGNRKISTSIGLGVTGSAQTATLSFRPAAAGSLVIERTVRLSPGLVTHYGNVLEHLFGIASGTSALGSIHIGGAAGAHVSARLVTEVSGASTTAALPIVASMSEALSSIASRKPLFLDGLEQSIDATRGTAWSVLLSETAGNGGRMIVRLYEAGNRSTPIAEKSISIGAYEQIRLDPVFASLGLDSAERRKDRTNVLCMITPESGSAVVAAVGIAADNATGDTKHFLFSPSGGVPATGVAKVSTVLVTPVTPPPSGGRKRLVRRP